MVSDVNLHHYTEAWRYDGDLFGIIWGPTTAAISVVFDHTTDDAVLKEALDGFLAVARIAASHRLTDVMDHLVASLCKFTALLQPGHVGGGMTRPDVAFGEDSKARMAAVTAFSIANKFGDCLRAGWCNLMDCVLRLHKVGLLPEKVTTDAAEDAATGPRPEAGPIQQAAKAAAAAGGAGLAAARNKSSSSLLRGFSQLLSLETEAPPDAPPSEQEQEAAQRAARCIEACRIDEVFADSKFLEAESLLHLAKALTWASGVGGGGANGAGAAAAGTGGAGAALAEDEDTALFCLDMLISVTLRNRDRIRLLLPLVYAHLRAIVQASLTPTPLAVGRCRLTPPSG